MTTVLACLLLSVQFPVHTPSGRKPMQFRLRFNRSLAGAAVALLSAPLSAQLFGPQQILSTTADGANSVFAADLDGDGDQDVLSSSSFDDKIAWYENIDGLGAFGAQQVITTAADIARSVFAADLDGDGDQDVMSASLSDQKIAWYENTDGGGTFGPQQVITTSAAGATSVFAADLDGDGDRDVLSASSCWPGTSCFLAWYENTDGLGTFGSEQLVTTSADVYVCVFAADLDGDGDQDVLSATSCWPGMMGCNLAWYENSDGLGTFGPQQVITTAVDGARSVFAADLDGDGDQDVLSASEGAHFHGIDPKIAWYENINGLGAFGPQQVITTAADDAWSVFSADLDGDGDQDVLSASDLDDKIAWYENTDGLASFGPQQVITTEADGAWSVFAADLDGDGYPDVLSASPNDDKIAWYENLHAPLMVDVSEISLAFGGPQHFALYAGVASGLQPYLILGSLSGTVPGIPVDGLVLPLTPDPYFLYSLTSPNSPTLTKTLGTLASDGTATAAVKLAPGMNPAFAGTVAHHAYAVFDLTTTPGQPFVSFVSNAVPLSLVP